MDTKTKPFDSFTAVYKILIWAGFYIRSHEENIYVKTWLMLYRILALVIVFVYNLAGIIFIVQPIHTADQRIKGLMIEIPQINLFWKLLTFTLYSSRVDKINELLHDPIFAAAGREDEKYLLKNVKEMHRLSKIINTFVTIAGVCWPASHIFQRLRDESNEIPFYVPFKTDTWSRYALVCFLQISPFLWVGYGHLSLDCLIATYYSQAQVQLKIIKHNLKHLFDGNSVDKHYGLYNEVTERKLYTKFVYYVKRYEKLVWYITEVNRVFNPSMTFQFLTSSMNICIVIYEMSETSVLSAEFMFLMAVIANLLIQVFIYCYYGNLVRHESESMNTCLYESEWTSSSPRLRRAMLIAMARWSRPMTTRMVGVIPLAHNTFVSIIKLSYSLYTVLSASKHT